MGVTSEASAADIKVRDVLFTSGDETLAGDLVIPEGDGPFPAVLTVTGPEPQNRLGDRVSPDGTVFGRPCQAWVGERLAEAGIAQLRYDMRGVGASTGGPRVPGDPPGPRDEYTDVLTDVGDASAALGFVSSQPEIDSNRIVVAGVGGGAYLTCLLAARTGVPAGYILWGTAHMGVAEYGDLLFGRTMAYYQGGSRRASVVRTHAAGLLERARHWPRELEAARAGAERFEWKQDGEARSRSLSRLRQEIHFDRRRQFANIGRPTLVIHGSLDMHVPVSEARAAVRALRAGCGEQVTLTVVPGADHMMHIGPSGMTFDERKLHSFRSRCDFPHSEFFISSLVGWIRDLDRMPSSPHPCSS